ncbi:MAG: helix-turn-helix domain-containing protein [Opitutales bacterium]|nr:helix-turn-helix domain-containing protein [Opitutales bacterium]
MEGIEVLFAVAGRRTGVRVRALARELGMTPTRVQRYLGTLAHLGLARRNPDRSYAVGPGIHALSAMSLSASGLAARAMRVLPPLDGLGCIVAVGVLWRHTVSYLYFNLPGTPLSESLGRDGGYPAERSSIGLLLLAHCAPAHVRQYFPEERERLAPRLEEVRREGHAIVKRPEGGYSIAVPVGSPPVAGLALSGDIGADAVPGLLGRMRAAARELSEESAEETPL